MKRVVVGYWDCSWCRNSRISGLERSCPSCGNSRGQNTLFYLDSNKEYLSDVEVRTVGSQPDWICCFCNSLNSDKLTECVSCGATKEDSARNYLSNRAVKENDPEHPQMLNSSKKKIGCLSFFIAIAAILFGLLKPNYDTVVVDSFSWQRTISVEYGELVDKSDWDLPREAILLKSVTEFYAYKKEISHYETAARVVAEDVIVGYETIVTGYTDLGNGTFQENTRRSPVIKTVEKTEQYQNPIYKNVPIYRIKYYYKIREWSFLQNIISQGDDDQPYWGGLSLAENEREGKRTEAYYVYLYSCKDKDNKKTQKFSMDLDEWTLLQIGDTVNVEIKHKHVYIHKNK